MDRAIAGNASIFLLDMAAESMGKLDLARREETTAEREARLRREAEVIARGHAGIEAGLGIEQEELMAWLPALDDDESAPMLVPEKPPPRP